MNKLLLVVALTLFATMAHAQEACGTYCGFDGRCHYAGHSIGWNCSESMTSTPPEHYTCEMWPCGTDGGGGKEPPLLRQEIAQLESAKARFVTPLNSVWATVPKQDHYR